MRSISFSDLLIHRVADGSKTQTRRPIKHSHLYTVTNVKGSTDQEISELKNSPVFIPDKEQDAAKNWLIKHCPHGKPGDVLYVKETHYVFGRWHPNGHTDNGGTRWKFLPYPDEAVRFDKPDDVKPNSYRKDGWYKRNSLFMPASYARLFLRIEDIRVERLNQISEEDAIAEGVEQMFVGSDPTGIFRDYSTKDSFSHIDPRESFRTLWESIYGPDSFDDRFVFVVKFSKTEKP